MADTLVTAVEAVIARVLVMEPLAVTAASYATKRWVEFRQDAPFWCNRVGPCTVGGEEDLPEYELTLVMRLILDYQENIIRLDNVDAQMQDNAYTYIASALRYFERYRMLNTATLAALSYVGPQGCIISCPVGLDLKIMPLAPMVYLAVDFNLVVPLYVGAEET